MSLQPKEQANNSILDILPLDIIKIVISLHPYSVWLLLNKQLSEIAKQLINPNLHRKGKPFIWSVQNNKVESVSSLLKDPRIDPAVDKNLAIRYSSQNGHTEIVRLLLQHPRVNPSADDNLAIQIASDNGHTEVVRLLLQDPRVDPSALNNYAIGIASLNGHTEIVKLLLQHPRVKATYRLQ